MVRNDQDWSGMIRTGQDWSGKIRTGQEGPRLFWNDKDWSEKIKTRQERSGLVRNDQDWSVIVWKLLNIALLFKIGAKNLDFDFVNK